LQWPVEFPGIGKDGSMTIPQAQLWKGTPFSIERKEGKTSGTVIFRLCGPFTARDMYGSLTPVGLRIMLDFQSMPGEEPPVVNILDLTEVPYMDSAGLGIMVGHYVSCQRKGIRLIAAGVGPRVRELLKMTKLDTTIPMTATVDEADNH
jgi:anti-anti-sigma regulatory factor